MCFQHTSGIRLVGPKAIAAMVLVGAIVPTTSASAAGLRGSFKGNAFGIGVSGSGALSGRVSTIKLACLGTGGAVRVRQVTDYSDGSAVHAGSVRSTVRGNKSATQAAVQDTSEVTALNMLSGLIKADQVTVVANATADADDISANAGGSQFSHLVIAGHAQADSPPADTTVALPGVGSVVLNHIDRTKNKRNAEITVEMLRLDVLEPNGFGLPVGSSIVVGHAAAGYTRAGIDGVLFGGNAYVAHSSASASDIRPVSQVRIPCQGTNGKTVSSELPSLDKGPVVTTGAGRTTAYGAAVSPDVIAQSTTHVANIGLLGGMVHASAIDAVATDRLHGGVRISSTHGSKVSGLKVGGLPLGTVTTANVSVNVPGIGKLIVNESRIPDSNSGDTTEANALHLSVLQQNTFGLPVGTEVIVGHATSLLEAVGAGAAEVAARDD